MTDQISDVISLASLQYGVPNFLGGAGGLNQQGVVVGGSNGLDGSTAAVVWHGIAVTALASLPGELYNDATAINNQGQIVGFSGGGLFSALHATLWQNGAVTPIGDPAYYSAAYGINDESQVVGVAGPIGAVDRAFIWQSGVMTYLPNLPGVTNGNPASYDAVAYDINDLGQVVGAALATDGQDHAVLWQNGSITDLGVLPGGTLSIAGSINGVGQVVGYSAAYAGYDATYTGFIWQNGTLTALASLPGYDGSIAEGINSAGLIVGEAIKTGASQKVAVLWENGKPIDLNTLLPASLSFLSLTEATAINDQDQILATDADNNSFLLTLGAGTAALAAASAAQSFASGTLAKAVPILDSGADIQAQLDSLETLAAAGKISSITLTDATAPTLSITAAQFARDSDALQDIRGFYTLTISGAITAGALGADSGSHLAGATISDSAANVAANINNVLGAVEGGGVATIHLTDTGTPILTLDSYELSLVPQALAAISTPYRLAITGETAAAAVTDAARPDVASVSVDDVDFDISGALDSLQALAVSGKLVKIDMSASSNIANGANIPVLQATPAQLTADAGAIAKITGAFEVLLTAPATSADFSGLAGQANILSFGAAASTYQIVAPGDGSSLVISDGAASYRVSNIQALRFTDGSAIIARTPGSDSITTGNITELYGAVFAREPDLAGLSFYQNYLAAHPATPLAQFAQWFLASAEYADDSAHDYAQTTDGETRFIADSYQNLLHRAPSGPETAYYLTSVIQPALAGLTAGTAAYAAAQSQAHAQMLVYFSASPEFLADVQVTAQSPASAQHWLVLV